MLDNNVTFKYLLIYGRGEERDKTQELRNKFLQKKTDNIRVCTFDSIKSVQYKFPRYMILSPKGDDKFVVKSVPDDFDLHDQGFFVWYSAENIIVRGECLNKLRKLGYEMDKWLDGQLLKYNNKYASDDFFRYYK